MPVPVALELLELLLEDDVGEVVVVVVVVVGVEVELVELVLELVEVDVDAFGVQLPTSWVISAAPWPRFRTSVVLTDGGRLAIALFSAVAPFDASTH